QLSPNQYYIQLLENRGEPLSREVLQAAYIADIEADLPIDFPARLPDGLEDVPGTQLIWLQNESNARKPLADRVEQLILQCLQKQSRWKREELEARIYAQYNGGLTPEPELVKTCIDAYTVAGQHYVTLRQEDTPNTRKDELRESRLKIKQLGVQLGFTVGRRLNADIVWKQKGHISYLFRFSSTALLSQSLANVSRFQSNERRCLVLPGGRASLVALKLRRDPRFQTVVTRYNWVFVKFRHLRRMLAEIKHRGEIDFYLGLDPIVEKDTVQIPLPLG
ncbi:MAG: hypothetical protein P1S60_04520, partial [Anaerolineae bacterium]|nr:hypothetical protein [Anaerolineae bacterium]